MNSKTAWPPAAACNETRKCVLVVEDEFLIRLMLADGLRDIGYHVIEACNSDEALVVLETATPDLIISDVRMPGSLDGLQLLAVVKRTFPSLPVIITSGHLQPEVAIAHGAAQFAAKPYSMEWVVEAVQMELAKAI